MDLKGQEAAYPLVGKLAVTYKFINEEQLKKALQLQKNDAQKGLKTSLEEVLARLDLISPPKMAVLHKVKTFLETRRQDKLFGQIAVQKQWVRLEAVNAALTQQADAFKTANIILSIGDILVEKRLLAVSQRDAIWVMQGRLAANETSIAPEIAEAADQELGLIISEDKLTARLRLPSDPKDLALEKIKLLLSERGVHYGVVPDEGITEWLQTGEKKTDFVIAQGRPAQPGTNAEIRYFFDTDYLRAGRVDADGQMDFKDRGKIPQVKTGELLAQKTLAVEGQEGRDVFGNTLPVEPVRDLILRCGSGAEISPDGSTVISKIDGKPLLTQGGQIDVYKNLVIPGDVDFKTGHIIFDGNVEVTGTVQAGFKINCINLSAAEIAGGIIQAKGDVTVAAGIIDAVMDCRGNITATFIKNSSLRAYGNVFVKKEIMDSEVFTSGICQVKVGFILTSSITAKKGVYSYNIGNGIAKASRLKVGVEEHLDGEIKNWQQLLAEKEKISIKLGEAEQALAEQLATLQNMVAEMAHVQERTIKEKQALELTLDRFAKKKAGRKLDHAEGRIQEFDQKIAATDETISGLFKEQEEIQAKTAAIQATRRTLDAEMTAVKAEMEGIRAWADAEPAEAIVKAFGAIYEGTVVAGSDATLVLRETYHNVYLRETHSSDWGGVSSSAFNIISN